VDRHRVDADPNPTFHCDADPDPDWYENSAEPHADPTQCFTRQSQYTMFLFSTVANVLRYDFNYFEQHIDANPDPDPAKLCGSDPIWILIYNTGWYGTIQ
jgi:hypothetical protein